MAQNVNPETEVQTNGTAARKPSEQALQVVDVAVGVVPEAADAVTKTVDQLRDPETRSQELQTLQHRVNNLRDSSTRGAHSLSTSRLLSCSVY